jgi:acetyltransferase-like isoleucine patch superfamily enzyme
MSDFPCFLWKHQAVIRDLAQSVLRPFFPLFMRGVYYKILGARVGRELGIGGTIADPAFTTLKDHVMIGHNAYLTAHAIVYDKLVLEPITVGMGATIGVNAVVMPGVDVGDQAIVAPGAVVARSTKILAGEFWGGVPAKKIKEMTNKECRMKNEAEGVPDPRAVLGARQSETWAAD